MLDRTQEFRTTLLQCSSAKSIEDQLLHDHPSAKRTNTQASSLILPPIDKQLNNSSNNNDAATTASFQPSAFTTSAQSLLITLLRAHQQLSQQHAEYANTDRYLSPTGELMSDAQRHEFEQTMSHVVRVTDQQLEQLKSSIREQTKSNNSLFDEQPVDLYRHQHAIVLYLFTQLHSLVERLSTMRAARMREQRAQQQLLHPKTFVTRQPTVAITTASTASVQQHSRHSDEDEKQSQSNSPSKSHHSMQPPPVKRQRSSMLASPDKARQPLSHNNAALAQGAAAYSETHNSDDSAQSQQLSAQELQQFEAENTALQEALADNLSEALLAEQKMGDISSLLTLFATKVAQQEEQIGTIFDTTLESRLSVTRGLEQLHTAGQRNMSTKQWMLFTILVLSFSLLFLDWYSSP